jgi:hypothetical protein
MLQACAAVRQRTPRARGATRAAPGCGRAAGATARRARARLPVSLGVPQHPRGCSRVRGAAARAAPRRASYSMGPFSGYLQGLFMPDCLAGAARRGRGKSSSTGSPWWLCISWRCVTRAQVQAAAVCGVAGGLTRRRGACRRAGGGATQIGVRFALCRCRSRAPGVTSLRSASVRVRACVRSCCADGVPGRARLVAAVALDGAALRARLRRTLQRAARLTPVAALWLHAPPHLRRAYRPPVSALCTCVRQTACSC